MSAAFRRILRIPTLILWTLLLFGPLVVASLWPGAANRKYRRRAHIVQLWAKGMATGMGMRIHKEGTPPKPPFILVCNHLGYTDIILLAASCPAYFISRADVSNWPFMGPIINWSNIIYINRKLKRDIPRVRALMKKYYDMGAGLIFFPEATSTQGAEVLPFKPPLLDLPAAENIPVHSAVIHYDTPSESPPAHRSICWWGDMEFAPHMSELLRLPYFDAKISFLDESLSGNDRKALASALHQKIASNFTPVE